MTKDEISALFDGGKVKSLAVSGPSNVLEAIATAMADDYAVTGSLSQSGSTVSLIPKLVGAAPTPAPSPTPTPSPTAPGTARKMKLNTQWQPLVDVLRTGPNQYTLSKEAADLRPTGDVDVREIVPSDTRIVWGAFKTPFAKSTVLRASDGGELILACTASASAPVWTPEADGTWSTLCPGTSKSSPVSDWHPDARDATVDGSGYAFVEVASRADIIPGTYYRDAKISTKVYAKPLPARAIDKWIIPSTTLAPALNISASTNITIWAENLTLVGGQGLYGTNSTSGVRPTVILSKCRSFFNLRTDGNNGFAAMGGYDIYLFDCESIGAFADAYGFHGNASGTANVLNIRPVVRRPSGNPVGTNRDNLVTTHETGYHAVVMPDFQVGSYGGVAGAIDSARMDIFGKRIPPSLAADKNWQWTLHAGNGAQLCVYETEIAESPGPVTMTQDGTGFIRLFGTLKSPKSIGTVIELPIESAFA